MNNNMKSKNRLFEVFQKVNNIKLNENSDSGLESYNILDKMYYKLINSELSITNTKTYVDSDENYVTLICRNPDNSIGCEFNFNIPLNDTTDGDIFNIGEIKLVAFKYESNDINFELEGELLDEFNKKNSDSFYEVVKDYIDVEDDTPEVDSLYENVGFGLNVDLQQIIDGSFDKLNYSTKESIIHSAIKLVNEYIKNNNIDIPREKYVDTILKSAKYIYTKGAMTMNETQPTPNEIGGNVSSQINTDNEYVEERIPTNFGENDEYLKDKLLGYTPKNI